MRKTLKKQWFRSYYYPARGPSVLTLSRETGVSEQSLYNWKAKYQNGESAETQRNPRQWTNDDKYEALLEAAKLTGEDLGK